MEIRRSIRVAGELANDARDGRYADEKARLAAAKRALLTSG
jgi:hypothetical protein